MFFPEPKLHQNSSMPHFINLRKFIDNQNKSHWSDLSDRQQMRILDAFLESQGRDILVDLLDAVTPEKQSEVAKRYRGLFLTFRACEMESL